MIKKHDARSMYTQKGTIMAKYDPVPCGDKISDVGRTCWSKFNHELRKLEA